MGASVFVLDVTSGADRGVLEPRREDVFQPVQPAGKLQQSQGTIFKPVGVNGAVGATLVPVTLTL